MKGMMSVTSSMGDVTSSMGDDNIKMLLIKKEAVKKLKNLTKSTSTQLATASNYPLSRNIWPYQGTLGDNRQSTS
jgi:hypothetical protein